MGMRVYNCEKPKWGRFEIAIIDVERNGGTGFDSNYKLVVQLSHNWKAYPIGIGSILAPGYVEEKFDMDNRRGEEANEFIKALQVIGLREDEDFYVRWFDATELYNSGWQVERMDNKE